MTAYLEWTTEGAVHRADLEAAATIGRDPNSTVPLDDLRASRAHAVVHELSGQFYLLDSGSRNGVFLNGVRITRPTALENGDEMTIGDTTIRFVTEGATTGERAQALQSATATIAMDMADIRWVTILVADIHGFTSLSEVMEIGDLSRLMSDWFYGVRAVVERFGGQVDKFVGDGVMALWSGPDPGDSVKSCLKAAVALEELTRELGEAEPQVTRTLGLAVGINRGMAAMSAGGDHSAIGDDVNLAFRLETAAKGLGYDVLLSRAAFEVLPAALWEGRPQQVKVKGKETVIDVCGFAYEELSFEE